jgi:hypothetical protein
MSDWPATEARCTAITPIVPTASLILATDEVADLANYFLLAEG